TRFSRDWSSDVCSSDLPDAPTPSTEAIVFITSNFYDGDLKTAGAGTTGLDGADKLCQLHADAASLAGTYRAWLSASTVDAIDRKIGRASCRERVERAVV